MNVVVGWVISEYGYMYIRDYTADELVGCVSNASSLGGFSLSCSFPAIKGHTYKVEMQNKVGTLQSRFYAL